MKRLATESEIIREGYNGYYKGYKNPYLPNTWAYRAWSDGYNNAAKHGALDIDWD